MKIVDFHNHYMGPSWTLTNLASVPPAARPAWEAINRNLQSQDALLSSVDDAGIAARVINTPTAFIEDADGNAPPGAITRINDHMADLVAKHPGKLYGLATVDAFSGDAGARELTRAVKELGLRGVFVESAKRDLLLGAKETRPTLAAAASLGVPVFVHPLTDPELHKRFSRIGRDRRAARARHHQQRGADQPARGRHVRRNAEAPGRADDARDGRRAAGGRLRRRLRASAATRPRSPAATSTSTPWASIRRWCGAPSICSAPTMC